MWNPVNFLSETQTGKVFKQRLTAAAILAVACFVGFIALFFGVFSVFIFLSDMMGQFKASLVIFSALSLLALILVLFANFYKKRPQTGSTLTSTALFAAPIGLRMFRKYPKAGIYSLLGIVLVSALGGRYLKGSKEHPSD